MLIRTVTSTGDSRARAMARVMVAFEAARGDCTRDDLLERGFTPAEIQTLADEARAIAARLRGTDERAVLGLPDPIKARRRRDARARRELIRGPHNDVRLGA